MFRPDSGVRVRPFRSAHSTQQNRVAIAAKGFCFIGKRIAGLIDGSAADQLFRKAKAVTEGLANVFKDAGARGCNLGADAIAR